MPDPVSVCNEALGELGSTLISSFSDGTSISTLCGELYPTARDMALELHPWNFAKRRAWLAQSAETPPFGWAYQYLLPPDYVKARGTDKDEQRAVVPRPWEIEVNADGHRVLMSDESPVGLIYTGRIEDLNLWSPLAVQVLVKVLASRLAKTLTGQNSVTELKWKEAMLLLPEGRKSDGREGTPKVLHLPGRLVAHRLTHGGVWAHTYPPGPND